MNPERILGALVRDALLGGRGMTRQHHRHVRGRSGGSMLGPGMKGMLGMGALGVAIAAFDHFARQQGATSNRTFTGGQTVPPPPPGSNARPAPPPPPPPPSTATPGGQDEALLLVRAMIAAANADHELDDDERQRIVRAVEESGAGADDRRLLLDELERPLDVATLAAQATTPALRREVYLASEMAIDADTKAEQNYLARLAQKLGLDDAQVAELRRTIAGSTGATQP
jgi:uncharacterized membrane protein YebE (DUF533 family)